MIMKKILRKIIKYFKNIKDRHYSVTGNGVAHRPAESYLKEYEKQLKDLDNE